jgi:hypothetical protein
VSAVLHYLCLARPFLLSHLATAGCSRKKLRCVCCYELSLILVLLGDVLFGVFFDRHSGVYRDLFQLYREQLDLLLSGAMVCLYGM